MKITLEQLEFSARTVIEKIVEPAGIYEYSGEDDDNIRLITLGEVSGVLKLRKALEDVLRKGDIS